MTEATAIGGALLHSHPDDKAAAEAVLHLLNRRLETIDGDYIVLADRTTAQERPPRPLPGFGERLRTQCRVIQALIIRETRTRFGDAKLGYGWALARTDPAHHDAVRHLLTDDAGPSADWGALFHFLLHRPHSIPALCPHQQRDEPCGHEQWRPAAAAARHDVRRHRGARSVGNNHRCDRRGHPAGRFWLHRPRGRAGRSVDAFNGASRHGDVRLRHRLYQCGAHGTLPVLGQDLASGHPPSLFLFRHFLRAGHDAGLGQRCARLEPVVACGRLVPGRLLRRVPTSLARPLLPDDPGDPAVALRSRARARDAATIVRAAVITLDNVSKTYAMTGGRKIVLQNATAAFASGYNYGVLGTNGAGESTLIRLLAGSEMPDYGRDGK